MSTDLSLHHRRRKPTADELADIPWLPLLQPHERTCAEAVLLVGDALPGDYVCRVGKPVTYWFGVVQGLLKMNTDTVDGASMTLAGLPRALVADLLDTAAAIAAATGGKVKKLPLLRGRTVVNLFFEPSTRTRILINVEISLPAKMLAGDSDDQLVRRGLFAINTTPTDQKPLIDAYEKAATGKDPDQRMVDDVKEFATN